MMANSNRELKTKAKSVMTMNYPSSWWGAMWREALPSGNGEIGAAVYGGVNEETVMLTHGDLWWKVRTPEMPDVSHFLPQARDLIMAGKAMEGDRLYADALGTMDYNPSIGSPLPLGDLKIAMPSANAFKKYRRSLDMSKGEVTVRWFDGETLFRRQLFVSRADDAIICRISSEGPLPVEAVVELDRHDLSDVSTDRFKAVVTPIEDYQAYVPEAMVSDYDDGFLYYSARNDDGTDFGAVARIIGDSARVKGLGSANDREHIRVRDDREVLLMIKLFIKDDKDAAYERLKEALLTLDSDYDLLMKRHEGLHSALLNRTTLDLLTEGSDRTNEQLLMEAYDGDPPAELIEKMWLYGRYLLISSSKEGGHPCHLYGLWCGEYEGMWAFNMLNENLQMMYWQALSGNMPELLMAVFDYYERMLPDLRENARKLYGCRGIYIPAVTTPDSGLLKTIAPHIIYWTGGAGWLAQHYYDYCLFTGDETFLRERALPMMKEAALFYEDFFFEGEDGYYVSCPSNSPENTPGNYWAGAGMGAAMETTINATMDFAIAKELLGNLIEGSVKCGMFEAERVKWSAMLKKIPPYEMNEDGAVKEWMHPFFEDNYHHRHESHLYPVFPGTEVTKDNNPELFEGFVEAVKRRLVIGLKQQTGWSLAHMSNNYARMGDGDQALDCLEIMTRSCVLNNLYTTHNDWRGMGVSVDLPWAPIQLDANMGLSAAVNEMLLFSVPGRITVLPALPEKWGKGKVERLLARGGVEVSIDWDTEKSFLDITLESKKADKDLIVVLPDFISSVTKHSIDEKNQIRVKLTKGMPLTIKTPSK